MREDLSTLTYAALRVRAAMPVLLNLDADDGLDWRRMIMETGGDEGLKDRAALVWALEALAQKGEGHTTQDISYYYEGALAVLGEQDHPSTRTRLMYACALGGWRDAQLRLAAAFASLSIDQRLLALEMTRRLDPADALPQIVDRVQLRSETCAAMAVGWAAVADGRRASSQPEDHELSTHARSIGRELWLAAAWAARQRRAGRGDEAEDEALDDATGVIPQPEKPNHVLVLEGITGSDTFSKDVRASVRGIVGKDVLLVTAPDLQDIRRLRQDLADSWPHATDVVDALLSDIQAGCAMRFRPTLLVGAPGAGKSRLVRTLLKKFCIPFTTLDAASCADQAITGSPRRWHHSYPSLPISTILSKGVANPVIVLDEIEKAGRSSAGSLHDPLLGLLERDTASAWRDQYLDAQVDVSWVSWLFTGNTVEGIPAPLLSRLRVLKMPSPGVEHVPALARTLVADILAERQVDPRLEPELDGVELEAVGSAFAAARGASLRDLRRIVWAALEARSMGWRN